jgi:hypothetical protein
MYAKLLRNAHHTRRFSIRLTSHAGWEICDEHDEQVTRRVQYTDWHRVERARRSFSLEAVELCRAGWVEA